VARPGDKSERDAQADRDHERAEMKQAPEKRPGQAVGQEVRVGH
jgi:hypothetical protein